MHLALMVLGALGACVNTPNNGTELASADAAVSFEGLSPGPRRLVFLEAAPTPTGPFVGWSGASTRSSLFPDDRIPLLAGLSAPVFDWAITTVIPAARWSTTTDDEGCSVSETFVRVRDPLHFYRTFDVASGGDPSGLECFQTAIAGGATPSAAYDACGSPENPVMRLVAGGSKYVGDVVIANASDVAAVRCYEEIEGSLSVVSSAPELIELPRLKRVTGALDLRYTSSGLDTSTVDEERCGAVGTVTAHVRKYALPQLASVGGDVTLRQEGTFSGPASTQAIDIGLEALTEVGGNLSIEIAQFGGSPCGLTALPALAGDFTLRFLAFGEIGSDSNKLAPNLLEVGGKVSLIGGHNTFANPLAALQRAGSLYMEHGSLLTGFKLPSLTDVTGLVELKGGGIQSQPTALLRAGSLLLRESDFSSLEQFGGATLELGGLELRDNDSLTALTSGPGTSKVALAPTAPFVLSGNPALTAASVCSFVDVQLGLGWSGPMDLDGVVCP